MSTAGYATFDAELVDRMVGAPLPQSSKRWTAADVILYNLGVGAGADLPEGGLRYVYEPGLVVLPSFATAVAHATGTDITELAGVPIDRSMTVHGEQELVLHRPIPVEADSVTTGKVVEISDMGGKHALIVTETETRADGVLLFVTRFAIVLRGQGGFGVRRVSPVFEAVPDEPADLRIELPTSIRQAAVYRLSGDRNPLHIDPAHARRVGFEVPILHGLSTFGTAVRGVVDAVLGGEPEAVTGVRARFGAPVIPGDTLALDVWRRGSSVHMRAGVPARGDLTVLSHGLLTLQG